MVPMPSQTRPVGDAERRCRAERRSNTLAALWNGNFLRRRRRMRRADDSDRAILDWHSPRWLALAVSILLLSIADAFLTLTLIGHGATEVNPAIAPFLERGSLDFAIAKITLTSLGVVVLTLLAQARAFGRRVAVSTVLYLVAGGYSTLIGYELWLLHKIG